MGDEAGAAASVRKRGRMSVRQEESEIESGEAHDAGSRPSFPTDGRLDSHGLSAPRR